MQQFYSHRVPKDKDYKNSAIEKIRRLCVVLRTGQQKYFERDTGEACNDLSPRKRISYRFGCIPELEKGCSYTRRELLKLNAHQVNISFVFVIPVVSLRSLQDRAFVLITVMLFASSDSMQ